MGGWRPPWLPQRKQPPGRPLRRRWFFGDTVSLVALSLGNSGSLVTLVLAMTTLALCGVSRSLATLATLALLAASCLYALDATL